MELPNTPVTPPKTPSEEGGNSSTTPASPKEATASVTPTKTPVVAIPKAASISVLPGTKLTKEEKQKILAIKEEIKQKIRLIRKILIIICVISVGWFSWLHINLSATNSVLSFFGVNKNLGQELKDLRKLELEKRNENKVLEASIEDYTKALSTKIYTKYSKKIQDIRDQQLQWYDTVDAEGNRVFGIINAVPHIRDYFNSRSYQDPDGILSGNYSDIKIKNLQVSRDEVNFSVESTHILGKIFFLNIEFIEMLNSFPFLKNGKLTQFSRQEKDDTDAMNFSIRLEAQRENEVDPADKRFDEYLTWLNSVTTK